MGSFIASRQRINITLIIVSIWFVLVAGEVHYVELVTRAICDGNMADNRCIAIAFCSG